MLKLFKSIFVCCNRLSFTSDLDALNIEKILTSKNFPAFKRVLITKEQFELYVKSSTSATPPRVVGEIVTSKNETNVNIEISQNNKLKAIFYAVYAFIIGIAMFLITMFLSGAGTFNHENIEGFLLTFSLVILSSIIVPKGLYVYERNKLVKILSRALSLHRKRDCQQ